jgi:hypothetical protein
MSVNLPEVLNGLRRQYDFIPHSSQNLARKVKRVKSTTSETIVKDAPVSMRNPCAA